MIQQYINACEFNICNALRALVDCSVVKLSKVRHRPLGLPPINQDAAKGLVSGVKQGLNSVSFVSFTKYGFSSVNR